MNDNREGPARRTGADEPPPIGGSWRRLYAAVLLSLGLLVAAFTFITRHFS